MSRALLACLTLVGALTSALAMAGCDVPIGGPPAVRVILSVAPGTVLEAVDLSVRTEDADVLGPDRTQRPDGEPLQSVERITLRLPAELAGQGVTITAVGVRDGRRIAVDEGTVTVQAGQTVDLPLSLAIRCGDGLRVDGNSEEACDDGNVGAGDGCDPSCEVETGYTCTDPVDATTRAGSMCTAVCGDGRVVANETCDDGNQEDGDGCSATCRLEAEPELCGNGDDDPGEDCDDGIGNSDTQPDACRESCLFPSCGDDVIDPSLSEECDDGGDNAFTPNACRPSCEAPTCGDGIIDNASPWLETCEDGNDVPGDGCSPTCRQEEGFDCSSGTCVPVCGDGRVRGYESCDDGNTDGADGCSPLCVIEPGFTCAGVPSSCFAVCADGLWLEGSEGCDDGNLVAGDGCSPGCVEESGWTCQKVNGQAQCDPACGDGLVLEDEVCDDGNTQNGDGCNVLCLVEPQWTCEGAPSECRRCGNGFLEVGESCDDGNNVPGDGCSPTCTITPGFVCLGQPSVCDSTCGNGNLDPGETCEQGDIIAGDGCSPSCRSEPGFTCSGLPSTCAAVCGDGLVRGGETCDDGNLDNGDGCSATCEIEGAYTCSGEPSVCYLCGDGRITGPETCDDGNASEDPVDGCKANCTIEPTWFCTGEPSTCTFPCGDFFGNADEDCDDGNLQNGDGCTDACTIEDGWQCQSTVGDPSVCEPTCGDGLAFLQTAAGAPTIEACDDGNLAGGDGCSNTCTVEVGWSCDAPAAGGLSQCRPLCGDGEITSGESCDDGNSDSGDGCSSQCVIEIGFSCPISDAPCLPVCGDGLVVGAEQCDDGAFGNGDGCSAACTVEDGFRCVGQPSMCVIAACGDAFVDTDEACDDGNTATGDGCDGDCAIEDGFICAGSPSVCADCGDGVVELPEQCDDNNAANGDGCTSLCQVEPGYFCGGAPSVCETICGNGIVGDANEDCDDGNSDDGDGCTAVCTVEPGWACVGAPSTCAAVCGDGVVLGAEQCDDGNTEHSDGCSGSCVRDDGWVCLGAPSTCSALCGDGLVVVGEEECDDGDLEDGDGCDTFCRIEEGFSCDGSPSACSEDCGDGIIGGAEDCDDGDLVPGDGCDELCMREPGWACFGQPSVCQQCGNGTPEGTEDCDDGNLIDGDGCSSLCRIEATFCGDGVQQPGEVCDDGMTLNGTYGHCQDDCQGQGPFCGDGNPDPEELCDDGANLGEYDSGGCAPGCQALAPFCGDGEVNGGDEVCDEGGAGPTCTADCQAQGQPRLAGGDSHTCLLSRQGDVRCWGRNHRGQLGIGSTDEVGSGPDQMGAALTLVDLGSDRTAVTIAAGGDHSCALLDDFTVKCWGANDHGQLGQGDIVDRGVQGGQMGAALLPIDLGPGRTARAISCGFDHTCALLDDGSVKCWGRNHLGQLGQSDGANRGNGPGQMGAALAPIVLGQPAVAIDTGQNFTAAMLADGSLKVWGENNNGQAGQGHGANIGGTDPIYGDMSLLDAVDVGGGEGVSLIGLADDSTCVLRTDGRLRCWGNNGFGELGHGDDVDWGTGPFQMGGVLPSTPLGPGLTEVQLTGGRGRFCALLDNGDVKCWGRNNLGQLGLGDTNDRGDQPNEMGDDLPPVELGSLAAVVEVRAGREHTCVRFDDEAVKCWGDNDHGQLGLGDIEPRGDLPIEMAELPYVETGLADAPVCGDGVAEGGELCDGADVRGATCAAQGALLAGGAGVGCTSACTLDLSGCAGGEVGTLLELQALLDEAEASGGGVVGIPAGDWFVFAPLRVTGTGITLVPRDGPGTVGLIEAGATPLVQVSGSDHTIRGLALLEGTTAIEVQPGASNILIEDNHIDNDGFRLIRGVSAASCQGLTVRRNRLANFPSNGSQDTAEGGVVIDGCTDVIVELNIIAGDVDTAIDIVGADGSAPLRIDFNTIWLTNDGARGVALAAPRTFCMRGNLYEVTDPVGTVGVEIASGPAALGAPGECDDLPGQWNLWYAAQQPCVDGADVNSFCEDTCTNPVDTDAQLCDLSGDPDWTGFDFCLEPVDINIDRAGFVGVRKTDTPPYYLGAAPDVGATEAGQSQWFGDYFIDCEPGL
jgi:cysteine-rich repeat protein